MSNNKIAWQSPSNIALVKYWGKKGEQLPANPSVSFTLSACHSSTRLIYSPKQENGFEIKVFLGGKEEPSFLEKINTFFHRITSYLDFLEEYSFEIHTENTFPHSSGIASSASGMSALALCLCELDYERKQKEIDTDFYQKASFIARLGSGSACRSVYGSTVVWGAHTEIVGSNDEFAVPLEGVHPDFLNYQDTILIVEEGKKEVSSSQGHNLLTHHPFALKRYETAVQNMSKINWYLQSGDHESFVTLVEEEALTLHALMLTSKPSFILIKPNTLEIIERVKVFRKEKNIPLCFTLDAGANVHLLYPFDYKTAVSEFIKSNLVTFCQNNQYICDEVGKGPKKL